MAIPLILNNYKLANKLPQNIILHHVACKEISDEYDFDNSRLQSPKYSLDSYRQSKRETGFNFIIDRFKNDFQVIVSQPLGTLCVYDDIDESFHKDIHIGFMGNYNEDMPMNRFYRVLTYRLLSPLLRSFRLQEFNILFHSTLSDDDSCSCPGQFIDMGKILNNLRSVHKRIPLNRSKTRG